MARTHAEWQALASQLTIEGRAFIDGQYVTAADGRTFDCINPATGAKLADISWAGDAEVEQAVAAARREHLDAVRRMFVDCDVFIFTLGLTEAWRSTVDQSVFPLAPGVVGGAFDPAEHAFVNFDLAAVEGDLEAFLADLKSVNPAVRVLLTVSPVPLIATYEKRHVLVSTTYSKSVLRVAAEQVMRRHDWVDYFPSYEIITGSYAGGLYYEDDFREVNNLGVAHAMRCFLRNYTEGGVRQDADALADGVARTTDVVCDEEAIAATA